MPDVRPAVFGLITLLLLYLSRASMLRPRSHGFFRFFAWEAILALVLLNAPIWFDDWLSWHQAISWLLLGVSIIPLAFGVRALRERGKPDDTTRPEPQLLAFERTTRLVSDGVYRYIRHPLYSSLLLLTWGVYFKEHSPWGVLLAASATLFLILTAKRDEAECLQVFGEGYQDYMSHTRMFIPYVF